MPLTTSFTVLPQVVGQPRVLFLRDDSTGSDAAVTERRVYLAKADGTYLTPDGHPTDYIVWQSGAQQISLDVLDRDYCLRVTVLWVNAGGTALYTASTLALFTLHLKQFYYDLTQAQTGRPTIVNDTPYYEAKVKLRCALDEAQNAVEIGVDHYSAQAALDRGADLMDHQTLYF
jgi:hypothetical protein